MKVAIYIEDGVQQLVLTPEGDFEKQTLNAIVQKPFAAEIKQGSFYECRGGYVRHSYAEETDQSLILTVKRGQ